MMIYVPTLDNYNAFSVIDSNTIRAYETIPQLGGVSNYRDYYINSHYVYANGVESFTTNVPVLIENSTLTDEIYYRNDFDSILIIFLIIAYICLYLPFKLFMRIFKKG